MARLLVNQPIALRIALLCLVPMLALIVISAYKIYDEYQRSSEAKFVLSVLDATPLISNLVHELQKERGTSAGFIGSKGAVFGDAIHDRRADTDAKLADFRARVPEPAGRLAIPAYADFHQAAFAALDQLTAMRTKVDAFDITVPQMAGYYTPLISDLLDMVESVNKVVDDGRTMRPALAFTALLQGKERAGIERAMGAAGFGSGTFNETVYRRFVRLGAMQDTFFNSFKRYAPVEIAALFDQALSGAVQDDVLALRKLAYAAPFGGDISSVTGPQWFGASTARIDAMKTVEDAAMDSLRAHARTVATTAETTFWLLSVILIALCGGAVVVSVFVYRSIVPPITRLVETMRRLSNNDVSVEVSNSDQTDEIGAMATSVKVFKDNAIERLRLEQQAREERDRERQRQSYIETLVAEFRRVVSAALDAANSKTTDMREASQLLAQIAGNAANEAGSAQSATGDASSNVQIMAAATEQLTASIQAIAAQTTEANTLMSETEAKAVATNEDVAKLSEAANQIGSVVNIIRDIAEQTNLLALNATIEAARAGEAGRGFAVVASEVKELAGQTAKATEEIGTQVQGIQGSTQEAVQSIQAITEAISEVKSLAGQIAGSVDEQLAATQEITTAVGQASSGTSTASGNVASVAESIHQTSGFAAQVETTSAGLAEATTTLASEVESFLKDVSHDVEERRKAARKQMHQLLVITGKGQRVASEMQDASLTGALIQRPDGIEINDEITVQMTNGLMLKARVVRFEGDNMGVQFAEPLSHLDALFEIAA